MKTQQGFYKFKAPQNIHVINSNYFNNINNNYNNNNISINKFNTFYSINYNNNKKNNNESNNYYSTKKNNTKNEIKYFLKSQNNFSKDFKSINHVQRRNQNNSISVNKNQNRTNIHFFMPKTHNIKYSNENKNSKNNLSTLPSIKTGYPRKNFQSQKKNTNTNVNDFFNRINNNFQNNNSSPKKESFLFLNSNKINNSYNKNNNNRYLQNQTNSSPKRINLIKKIKLNSNRDNNNNTPSLIFLLKEKYSLYKDAKYSDKAFNVVSAYGVNTYRGTIRNYNEDRITVIVNAKYYVNKKLKNNNSEKISYFGIYDGHAGNKCCEFLKNNLHNYIFESHFFPNEPIKAIEQGFNICEKKFIESLQIKTNKNNFRNKNNQSSDYSGSCALIILIINNICYTINLGDSRALYSYDSGKKFYQLSRDHKPNDPIEKERIYNAGGSIFKTNIEQFGIGIKESELGITIPYRIIPGRLAVSKYIYIYLII